MWQRKPEREQKEETEQSRWGFRGMTVRNWLELLIVPLVLVGIGLLFEMQQSDRQRATEKQQQELAEQRAQDEALQAYLNQMSQLMLERKLLEAEPGDPVHTLAQARTSTVIFSLDAEHNESVTRFLINSGLAVRIKASALPEATAFASHAPPGVSASPEVSAPPEASARLLREITLSHATLSDAYLPNADLTYAEGRIGYREGTRRNGTLGDIPSIDYRYDHDVDEFMA